MHQEHVTCERRSQKEEQSNFPAQFTELYSKIKFPFVYSLTKNVKITAENGVARK